MKISEDGKPVASTIVRLSRSSFATKGAPGLHSGVPSVAQKLAQ